MSGRIRTVKPEWLEDERLLGCSERARLLTVVLILLADDYGNGRGMAAYIQGQAGLYAASVEDVERALGELEAAAFITRYVDSGQTYYSIRSWAKHQRVDKPGKPRVPGPPSAPRKAAASPDRAKVAYFIRGAITGLIKIGESIDPVSRLADLAKCGSETLELLAIGGTERELHAELAASRVHGEWFSPSPAVLAKIREFSGGRTQPIAIAGYDGNSRNVREEVGNVPDDPAPDHDHDQDQRPTTGTTKGPGGDPGQKAQGSAPKSKTKPHVMPADFGPSDTHRAYATEHGLDLDAEAAKFCDHHRAKGSTFASWPHALSTWLRNSVDWRQRDGARPTSGGGGRKPTGMSAMKNLFDRAKESM